MSGYRLNGSQLSRTEAFNADWIQKARVIVREIAHSTLVAPAPINAGTLVQALPEQKQP